MKQPLDLQFRHIGRAADNLAELTLDILEYSGEIRCDHGVTLAQISKKMHLILRRIPASSGTTFHALVNEEELRGKLSSAAPSSRDSKPVNVMCCMELLVSGPRRNGHQIAEALAQGKLFLQNPIPYTTVLPYEDPQYLKLPGTFLSTGFELAPLSGEWAQAEEEEDGALDDAVRGSRHKHVDLQRVLDELPAMEGLRAAETDVRVTTELLR